MKDSPVTSAGYVITSSSGGGSGNNFQYQVTQVGTPPAVVPGLCVTSIQEPVNVTVQWLDPDVDTFDVQHTYNGVVTPLVTNIAATSFTDPCLLSDYALGQPFTISVRVDNGHTPDLGLPSPPPNPPANSVYTEYTWGTGPWTNITVIPQTCQASDDQTADGRLDTRYALSTFLNFQFGTNIYNGGLFVGNNSDPAQVARSFVKIPITLPTTSDLWAASTSLYYTGSKASGSTTIGLTPVSDTSWTGPTLVWGNAPALNPATPESTVTVTYDTNNPTTSWINYPAIPDILNAAAGDGVYSFGLASTNESSGGWAYLAKKEYNASEAPHVIYAAGAPAFPSAVSLSPTSVEGGYTVNGTVYLNGVAPAGGASVSVGPNNPMLAVVTPSTITIPAGSMSGNFVVSTPVVTSTQTVGIYGFNTGAISTNTATLTITP
jgi:hypothetical protein